VPIWPSCSSGPVAVINGPCPEPGLQVSQSLFTFELPPGGAASQILTIADTGTIGGSVTSLLWEIPDPDCAWLSVNPTSGAIGEAGGTADLEIFADAADLDPGTYLCDLTIISNACHLPYATVDIELTVAEGDTAATLLSIVDVPNDQGRNVRLSWEGSPFDAPDIPPEITGYGVYRRQDASLAKQTTTDRPAAGPRRDPVVYLAADADPGKLDGWDFLVMVPAHGDSIYHYVAPTLCDSTDQGICWSVFFLRTMTADPFTYWDCLPDSGYSVDNLFPGAPANFSVAYYAAGNDLSWDENPDPDIYYYNIYRASWQDECAFPGGEPTASVPATSWTDDLTGLPGSAWEYCYFVTAVDFNGNEGEPSSWLDAQLLGVDNPVMPDVYALHPCYPNPFNPATTIRFDLPQRARVDLQIYDVSGRWIQQLVASEDLPAGRHEVVWRGQDDTGRPAAAGVYFYRLQAGPFTETKRMTLVK